jgi:hypothetical protein
MRAGFIRLRRATPRSPDRCAPRRWSQGPSDTLLRGARAPAGTPPRLRERDRVPKHPLLGEDLRAILAAIPLAGARRRARRGGDGHGRRFPVSSARSARRSRAFSGLATRCASARARPRPPPLRVEFKPPPLRGVRRKRGASHARSSRPDRRRAALEDGPRIAGSTSGDSVRQRPVRAPDPRPV